MHVSQDSMWQGILKTFWISGWKAQVDRGRHRTEHSAHRRTSLSRAGVRPDGPRSESTVHRRPPVTGGRIYTGTGYGICICRQPPRPFVAIIWLSSPLTRAGAVEKDRASEPAAFPVADPGLSCWLASPADECLFPPGAFLLLSPPFPSLPSNGPSEGI